MGKMTALVKSGFARSLHKRLPFRKVKIAFKTSNRSKNYFSFKDVPEPLRIQPHNRIYSTTYKKWKVYLLIRKTVKHLRHTF